MTLPRACARATMWAPSTARVSTCSTRPRSRPPKRRRPLMVRLSRPAAMGRSRRKSSMPGRFISPRTITSNTWPRTPTAIAAWAAPASPAPSGPASPPSRPAGSRLPGETRLSEAPLGGPEDRAAFGGQLGHGHGRTRLARLRVEHLRREPLGQLRAATISAWRRILIGAIPIAGRTGQADVEVVVVAVDRPDFPQPPAVLPRLPAQGLLDRRVHEDAGDAPLHRGRADEGRMLRRPRLRVDVEPVF